MKKSYKERKIKEKEDKDNKYSKKKKVAKSDIRFNFATLFRRACWTLIIINRREEIDKFEINVARYKESKP